MPAPGPCPVADGGEGTLEVLLTALGGETAAAAALFDPLGRPMTAGFGLLEGGATHRRRGARGEGAGAPGPRGARRRGGVVARHRQLIAAAVAAGAPSSWSAAGGRRRPTAAPARSRRSRKQGACAGAPGRAERRPDAVERAAGLRAAEGRRPAAVAGCARGSPPFAGAAPRPARCRRWVAPRAGLPAGCGPPSALVLEPGAAFVLGALGFEARMRAARAVVVGEGRVDASTPGGQARRRVADARPPGRGALLRHRRRDGLGPFGARVLDLQRVLQATTLARGRGGRLRRSRPPLSCAPPAALRPSSDVAPGG